MNCYGTWVKTDGIDSTQYEKNPVLLWMHWRGNIIGTIKNFKVENGEITGEPCFDEVRDESKMAKQQYELGSLRMCSPNFDIIEMSEEPEFLKPGQTRPTVTKCKLIEVSMVDIGGNDDALVLSYQGNQLKLAAGEENDALPLLKINSGKNDPHIDKSETKTETTMDYKVIALKLGLPETATENEVLGAISILLGYKAANEVLQGEKESLQLLNVTQVVDNAIAGRKISAEKKAHFIALGKTVGIESLQLTFDAMNAVVKPTDVLGGRGGNMTLAGAGDWKKLSDVPSDKLMELRDGDKATYMRLYRAEYGVDCPKY